MATGASRMVLNPIKQEKHDGEKEVKWAGAKILLGDKYYIVPPLSIGQLETHKELIAQARTMRNDDESMIAAMPLLHSAFSRNYPDMTLDELKDRIDLASFHVVCFALWNISGIVESKEGDPGEASQPRM